MKITDDYNAKFAIWARETKVHGFPRIANLPRFGSKKFSSYKELNDWKQELLLQLARKGGAKWTK
jgi:hypothetical protein